MTLRPVSAWRMIALRIRMTSAGRGSLPLRVFSQSFCSGDWMW